MNPITERDKCILTKVQDGLEELRTRLKNMDAIAHAIKRLMEGLNVDDPSRISHAGRRDLVRAHTLLFDLAEKSEHAVVEFGWVLDEIDVPSCGNSGGSPGPGNHGNGPHEAGEGDNGDNGDPSPSGASPLHTV